MKIRFANFPRTLIILAVSCAMGFAPAPSWAAEKVWRFDCGTDKSPVMAGYERLTGAEQYSKSRGYGWETPSAQGVVFDKPIPNPESVGSAHQDESLEYTVTCRNDLNSDGVVSEKGLAFRLDVPNGRYRVNLTVGDMFQAIGSIDVKINGTRVAKEMAAWGVGSYRMWDQGPGPWWRNVHADVDVKDGAIRIVLSKNQAEYDRQLAEQQKWENPYAAKWYHAKPVVPNAPYFFIGVPFKRHSIMAIEVAPSNPGPLVCENGKLRLTKKFDSPTLAEGIKKYNAGDFEGAFQALKTAPEPETVGVRALAALYLAGRLEIERERMLIPAAVEILRQYVAEHPGEDRVAEALQDAEHYLKAWDIHVTRGETGKRHFAENGYAIDWWLLIGEESPLYDKAQLQIVRAGSMLKPYFPKLGTEGEILKRLEKKCPTNRYVKYYLHQEWTPSGDGSDFYDWIIPDYAAKAKGAPKWVQAIYPAYAGVLDLCEWWLKFRQREDGSIGGGWGDNVEMVGLFGYYGMVSPSASPTCIAGANKLCEGVWHSSSMDQEAGYCKHLADAEHSAEWTGDSLGMMMRVDYGDPVWIERAMKTGKLVRDLWTGFNAKKQRHFRSNFLGASKVGDGDQANDSFINYRAVSPSNSVLSYNGNPTIAKLYCELADAWVADAMSTERGKPKGVIPAQVSFPDALLGGTNSPNWWTASHPEGTVNYNWWTDAGPGGQKMGGADYKGYLLSILLFAYDQTRDMKYLEPMKLECELAKKFGYDKPKKGPAADGQGPGIDEAGLKAEPGSEPWVAARIANPGKWLEVERMVRGREGDLELTRTKEEVIKKGQSGQKSMKEYWPNVTSEAGPTDRVHFDGMINPFFIYTGGKPVGNQLSHPVTYDNTTRDYAAAVLGADAQGFKLLYYSLAPDARKIGLIPWELESGGKYRLRCGVDADDNGTMDKVLVERDFVFPQIGSRVPLNVEPRTNYIVEVSQLERGRPMRLASDPGLSAEDIEYDAAKGEIRATVHNLGSKSAKHVTVDFYEGDPKAGGKKIASKTIGKIEAPIDLEPRTKTVAAGCKIEGQPREFYVVLDAEDRIKDEITTFNNVAKDTLPNNKKAEKAARLEKMRAAEKASEKAAEN